MKSLSCSHWKCRHGSKMEGPNTFPVATLKLLTTSWRGDFFHLLREVEKLGAHHWMKARCLCQFKNQSPNSLVHQLHHSHPVAVRKDNGSSVRMLWPDLRGFWDIYVVQKHKSYKWDAPSQLTSHSLATVGSWRYRAISGWIISGV